jgi:hypothetical protein
MLTFMRLFGDGKHDHTEPSQTFRCQACHTTFSERRHTPLYRLKPPSQQVAMVLTALAEGLDPSAAERVFGYRQATVTSLSDARGLARTDVTRALLPPSLAPAPPTGPLLRTRLRCSKRVLWLWVAIDPCTKLLPAFQLGPRTQHMAYLLIHSIRQMLAPGCLPLFTSDGLNVYFSAALRPFWTLAQGGTPRMA